ncbi:MAG: hypothetical protein QW507_02180 [Candidatus Nanoarchaeia archaeon]|nr:hypothetical protein [Candidatus Haiyanarchaeum thermophilum]MCW1304122.1 hypothetical protein [Candidatus Haiyanarchaeum thermophilum]MCW1306641.1 hypothetical protein [Candidatus Haiyanarchaeum thermophilum]MCW1307403.1 hypothetical protein [Candidatus Haiyanarchaeum thermophilum]MCW1308019.1 hypothetical protein [Candidatus Haiyanarchaeum thermophilum]
MKGVGDLGSIRIPVTKLRYRYNLANILTALGEKLKKTAEIAYQQSKSGGIDVFCSVGFPVLPQEEVELLGSLPTQLCQKCSRNIKPVLFAKDWRGARIYFLGWRAKPYQIEDLLTSIEFFLENERINYFPFIAYEIGISKVRKGNQSHLTIYSGTLRKEKFIAPFQSFLDFLPHYLRVAEVSDLMFSQELFKDVNLAVDRISRGLVWTRRTKDGRDIRINNPHQITHELVPWGAYKFFAENNLCYLPQTNCLACEENCSPRAVIFDLDPGKIVNERTILKGLEDLQRGLEEIGVKYTVKLTGGSGFHVVVYLDGELRRVSSYIPLRVLKHSEEMSSKYMKQVIEQSAENPFEVVRDFVRCFTDYVRSKTEASPLVHDMSRNAWDPEHITVDAQSIKRRGYHITYYSLNEKGKVCLPICQEGTMITKDHFSKFKEISEHPESLLRNERELIKAEEIVRKNPTSFISDLLEDYEAKLYKELYQKVLGRINR